MIHMTFSINKELKNWNKCCTANNHYSIRFTNGQSRVEKIRKNNAECGSGNKSNIERYNK